ncbi:site-specific integrase [Paraburkholderia sp. SIMBA_049]
MKSRLTSTKPNDADFPDADALAALRAWYAGLSSKQAVARYLVSKGGGVSAMQQRSARGVLGGIRRRLVAAARQAQRDDLVALLAHPATERTRHAKAVALAIDQLRTAVPPEPQNSDPVEKWFPARTGRALHAQGIVTLADLAVRIPRRRQWWTAIPDLGAISAKRIEGFFGARPALLERARALIATDSPRSVVPWESLRLPNEVDGSAGTFRAPSTTCTLDASNDYEAVQAWLSLHESVATQRTYRKEAERVLLWAIVERGRALSSLTTEDAIAYRTFLQHPTPAERWVGPLRPRSAPDWRPFAGNLSPPSAAHALSILGALFRWLVEQRYVLANPFAGVKVRAGAGAPDLDASRAFTEGEWTLLRTLANGLEWSYGWSTPAAQRLRFLLDFGFSTGLRASELVGATLRNIETDAFGDHWLRVTGKGHKAGRVALPPLAWDGLARYLVERRLPVSPTRWAPDTPLVGSLDADDAAAISGMRLWAILKRFFNLAAIQIATENPALSDKLRRASPHWMRHTHATHALANGAELTTVRDNLRHASISTTSIYLHSDDAKRARQIRDAFGT